MPDDEPTDEPGDDTDDRSHIETMPNEALRAAVGEAISSNLSH